jgi:imidazolonepropionase-like amidohydrolase
MPDRVRLILRALIPALLLALSTLPAQAGERIALRCGQLIDGRSEQPRKNVVVLVEDGRIVSIGDDSATEGARVIDLSDATVLPGMIDAHSHPLLGTDDYQTDHLKASSASKALTGLRAAQDNLMAGWTTLRIAGDGDVHYAMQDIGRAIEQGLFSGPRITGAGHYISATGGGGDINFIAPEQRVVADGLVVDGVDEMRKAVRREIKFGSDWIKLLVTGAFMSLGDSPGDVHFSPEELTVAVEEAARRRVPVMAHAHAAEGIKQAIRAGVRSIEHGTFVDEEGLDLMLEHDVFWVPTIYVGEYYIEVGSDTKQMEKMIELSIKTQDAFEQRVARGIEKGVRIAVGSDFGGYTPHINARELRALIRVGMTPMQAIQAATRVGAELLGWDDRLGTIESGKIADLIAVPGDPLQDISILETVGFVMKDGIVVKGH